MSPQTFDEAWPALADRLRCVLIARRVPTQDRDDVMQETALRVYRVWDTLDPDRPVAAFVNTVALNIWRDLLRERLRRDVDLRPTSALELTSDHDVERTVLARQELEHVTVAMQRLPQAQRRLLLETEEFGARVQPLAPAQRVARMRARRQLARVVGRASGVLAFVWLRRPGRTAGVVATAYVGAMAAAVMSTPAPVPALAPKVVAAPPAIVHALPAAHPVAPAAAHRAVRPAAPKPTGVGRSTSADASAAVPVPTVQRVPPTRVCSPQQPPAQDAGGTRLTVGSVTVSLPDGSGKEHPLLTTPEVRADSATGCVDVH